MFGSIQLSLEPELFLHKTYKQPQHDPCVRHPKGLAGAIVWIRMRLNATLMHLPIPLGASHKDHVTAVLKVLREK